MISAPKPSISPAPHSEVIAPAPVKLVETDLPSAKTERAQQIAPAPASSAAEATSVSPGVITETGFPVDGRADHTVTATVTKLECPQQMAPADASDAEKYRKFFENVVVWPGRNDTGWINMEVRAEGEVPGYDKFFGWPFRNVDAFINQARWVDRAPTLTSIQICISQQSQCRSARFGELRAVTRFDRATWLRSIWIKCVIAPSPELYHSREDAWSAIVAVRRKVGLPFPSAVVTSGALLQVYWISDIPLSADEWKPYAYGLSNLLQREGVKCEATTHYLAELVPVPGTMDACCLLPGPVELVYLGRRYDFSNALSVLPTAAIEAEVSRLLGRRRKSRRVSGDPK
jgi:hypothetical protein